MKISTAFPSLYLKAEDIPPGRDVSLEIDCVTTENVSGNGSLEDEKPVLHFVGKGKGLVLNKTNALVLSEAFGDETDNWTGRGVLLFATTTQFQGRATPCLRIRVPSNEQPAGAEEVPF